MKKDTNKLIVRLNILENRLLKISILIKDNYPNNFNRLNKIYIITEKKINIITKLIKTN